MAKLVFGMMQSLDGRNVESAEEHDFAAAWRSQPKWVVSRSLKSVGPNATFVENDMEAPPLRLVAADRVGEDTVRVTYVPA
jgi:hypothetical protein